MNNRWVPRLCDAAAPTLTVGGGGGIVLVAPPPPTLTKGASIVNWYDREGRPISMDEWVALLGDESYKRVAESNVDEFWVSTVWLGLDHDINGGKLIFETMVWEVGSETIVYGPVRYSTYAAAKTGHDYVVATMKRRKNIGRE